ncbi:SDR family oxidoreductase [Streptomyces sp. NPDC059564]|uniref:SDR family oxidoreductase n=1 Tax=Streptomyces sp. NPDC059564 TaxID=3346865 RepID=UPI0036951BCB
MDSTIRLIAEKDLQALADTVRTSDSGRPRQGSMVDARPLPATLPSPADPMRLAGKVVIITGAASGIGRAVARLFSSLGSRLVLTDLDAQGLKVLDEELGDSPDRITVDGNLNSPGTAARVLEATLDRFGTVDSVVFAAGASATGRLSEISAAEFSQSIERNLEVHFPLSQAVLAHFSENAATGTGCSLVYIVSKVAVAPSVGFGAYPIAKAAELQLARIVALEGAAVGVRANVVNPGAVFEGSQFWGPELRAEKSASHRVAPEDLETYYAQRTMLRVRVTPTEVAETVAFLASPCSRATTGAVIPVDGGLPTTFGR